MEWTPQSWRERPAAQQPEYSDPCHLQRVLERLSTLPPLVTLPSVIRLREHLQDVGLGKRFLLQGGDCAERFVDCREEVITSKLKVLLQMSMVLTYGLRRPVVRIGRLAGQYSKPRSSLTEMVAGTSLPVYRGDLVNDYEPSPLGRASDPERLLQAYFHAAATLNHVRAQIEGGFADLQHPENWNLNFVIESERRRDYETIVERIDDAISFMRACGSSLEAALGRIDFFTSHEALVLPFEEAMTRTDEKTGVSYNAGAHFLWVGDRTRELDGAHVEYLRGIANPVGVKVGPTCSPEELLRLAECLNPDREVGRLTLITRLGATNVSNLLPPLIRALREAAFPVVWSCDPMHGNTILTSGGVKTRVFDQILSELRQTVAVHRENDSHLGGVHFELTGENVTECLGGARRLVEADLQTNYATYCDPRLNLEQSLEMAFLLVQEGG